MTVLQMLRVVGPINVGDLVRRMKTMNRVEVVDQLCLLKGRGHAATDARDLWDVTLLGREFLSNAVIEESFLACLNTAQGLEAVR